MQLLSCPNPPFVTRTAISKLIPPLRLQSPYTSLKIMHIGSQWTTPHGQASMEPKAVSKRLV